MAKDYKELATNLLELVGGKDNVSTLSRCVTRLRFKIKDKSLIKEVEIKKQKDVIGTQWLGEQFQVIVGNEVEDIYRAVCEAGSFSEGEKIQENLDPNFNKTKFSLKDIGKAILAYTSPTMTGVIPILMGACLCKTLASILGPQMLNLISDTSDLTYVLNMLYNAFFYFMPFFLGYTASKALNIRPVYGLYLAGVIMVPDLVNLVGVKESISVFGINAPVASYAQSFLPVMLGVWLGSYVVKFLAKYLPTAIKSVFEPFLFMLIMAPVVLCVCAPLGATLGNYIGGFFDSLSRSNIVLRALGGTLLGVLMPFMILGGLHGALVTFAFITLGTYGVETFSLPIMTAYNFAVFGISLGALLKMKHADQKVEATGYFLSGILGSVTEPILFGIVVKYKNALKALVAVCAIIGLYVGIFTPNYYSPAAATIFTFFVPWVGGATSNLINGCILIAISFFGAALTSYLLVDFDKEI